MGTWAKKDLADSRLAHAPVPCIHTYSSTCLLPHLARSPRTCSSSSQHPLPPFDSSGSPVTRITPSSSSYLTTILPTTYHFPVPRSTLLGSDPTNVSYLIPPFRPSQPTAVRCLRPSSKLPTLTTWPLSYFGSTVSTTSAPTAYLPAHKLQRLLLRHTHSPRTSCTLAPDSPFKSAVRICSTNACSTNVATSYRDKIANQLPPVRSTAYPASKSRQSASWSPV